jgi:hypothetical protein
MRPCTTLAILCSSRPSSVSFADVADELIWQGRRCLPYNNQGKRIAPVRRVLLSHSGSPPMLNDFDAAMGEA